MIYQYSDVLLTGLVTYKDSQGVVRPYTGPCTLYAANSATALLTVVPIDINAVDGAWSHEVYVDTAGQWKYEARAISPIHGSSGVGTFIVTATPFAQ